MDTATKHQGPRNPKRSRSYLYMQFPPHISAVVPFSFFWPANLPGASGSQLSSVVYLESTTPDVVFERRHEVRVGRTSLSRDILGIIERVITISAIPPIMPRISIREFSRATLRRIFVELAVAGLHSEHLTFGTTRSEQAHVIQLRKKDLFGRQAQIGRRTDGSKSK